MTTWILACLLLASGGPASAARGSGEERPLDRVLLADGKELEGYVLREDAEGTTVLVGTRRRVLPAADVAGIESISRSLDLLLDQYVAVHPTEPRHLLDLARFARSRRLEGLAELFALRALAADPEHRPAHEFLEHKRYGAEWRVRVGKRWVSYETLIERREDWQEAWEILTPHYALRTNLGLDDALNVAMDLELFYREFYDRFAAELGLYEVVKRMPAHVHANADSFPKIGGRLAYFDPRVMTTQVNAERGYQRDLILHEATHQLLYATAMSPEYSSGARGCVPAWLDEGLACWYQTVQTGPPGLVTFEYRKQWTHFMTVHGTNEKPYDLSRVLSFGSDDFHASSRVDLKYAQAYTLVEFFQNGEFYRHRETFFEVMRQAYAGNCAAHDVKRLLLVDDDEFEQAWTEFVRRR